VMGRGGPFPGTVHPNQTSCTSFQVLQGLSRHVWPGESARLTLTLADSRHHRRW
jgi:hypothetical protein